MPEVARKTSHCRISYQDGMFLQSNFDIQRRAFLIVDSDPEMQLASQSLKLEI